MIEHEAYNVETKRCDDVLYPNFRKEQIDAASARVGFHNRSFTSEPTQPIYMVATEERVHMRERVQ